MSPTARPSDVLFGLSTSPDRRGRPGDILEVAVDDNGGPIKATWTIPPAYQAHAMFVPPSSSEPATSAKIKLLRAGPVVVHARVDHSIGVILIASIAEGIVDNDWFSLGHVQQPNDIGGFRVINDPAVLEKQTVYRPGTSPLAIDFSKESLLEMHWDARYGIGEGSRPAVTSISPERIEVVVPAVDDTRQKFDWSNVFYLFKEIPKVRDDCVIDVITLDSLNEAIRW